MHIVACFTVLSLLFAGVISDDCGTLYTVNASINLASLTTAQGYTAIDAEGRNYTFNFCSVNVDKASNCSQYGYSGLAYQFDPDCFPLGTKVHEILYQEATQLVEIQYLNENTLCDKGIQSTFTITVSCNHTAIIPVIVGIVTETSPCAYAVQVEADAACLVPGAQHHWTFDDSYVDSVSGTEFTLTNPAGLSFEYDAVCKTGLVINGTQFSGVSVPASDIKTTFAGSFTIAFWMRGYQFGTSGQPIINKRVGCGATGFTNFFVFQMEDDLLRFVFSAEHGLTINHWNTTLQSGELYHVAATYNGTEFAYYVNGIKMGSLAYQGTRTAIPGNLEVGLNDGTCTRPSRIASVTIDELILADFFIDPATLYESPCVLEECCANHTAPGCNDVQIQNCVCSVESSCCASSWNSTCVALVDSLGCGQCSTGPCCSAHEQKGCENTDTSACVCKKLPKCCLAKWTQDCVDAVNAHECSERLCFSNSSQATTSSTTGTTTGDLTTGDTTTTMGATTTTLGTTTTTTSTSTTTTATTTTATTTTGTTTATTTADTTGTTSTTTTGTTTTAGISTTTGTPITPSCATNNCSSDATCSDTNPGYTCACKSGYSGNGYNCTLINPCPSGIQCLSGACATSAIYCGNSSNQICSNQLPYMCSDTSCVVSYKECPQSPCQGTLCWDGSCVTSNELCSALPSCPALYKRCGDGTCVPASSKCVSETDACIHGVCPDGSCAPCYPTDACPAATPIMCPIGVCANTADVCRFACKKGEYRCYNGDCKRNPSSCDAPPRLEQPIPFNQVIPSNSTASESIPVFSDLNFDPIAYITVPESILAGETIQVRPVFNSELYSVSGSGIWGDSSFDSGIISSILALEVVDMASPSFTNPITISFSASLLPKTNISDLCLAFVNTTTNKWQCESGIIKQGDWLIGNTSHFTTFTVVTSKPNQFESPFDPPPTLISVYIIATILALYALGLVVTCKLIRQRRGNRIPSNTPDNQWYRASLDSLEDSDNAHLLHADERTTNAQPVQQNTIKKHFVRTHLWSGWVFNECPNPSIQDRLTLLLVAILGDLFVASFFANGQGETSALIMHGAIVSLFAFPITFAFTFVFKYSPVRRKKKYIAYVSTSVLCIAYSLIHVFLSIDFTPPQRATCMTVFAIAIFMDGVVLQTLKVFVTFFLCSCNPTTSRLYSSL